MAMDDLPLAVLAPVDVGGADRDLLGRTAVYRADEALVANRVRHVADDVRHLDVISVVGHVREPRGDPGKQLAQLTPSRGEHPGGAEQGDRVTLRPELHSGARIPLMERRLGSCLLGEELPEVIGHVHHTATLAAQSGACGRLARSRGRIRNPAITMITAPASATKIA